MRRTGSNRRTWANWEGPSFLVAVIGIFGCVALFSSPSTLTLGWRLVRRGSHESQLFFANDGTTISTREAGRAHDVSEREPDIESLLAGQTVKSTVLVLPEATAETLRYGELHAITGREIFKINDPNDMRTVYSLDLAHALSFLPDHYLDRPLVVRFGDSIFPCPVPCLTKARVVGDANAVVLPMEYGRHFSSTFKEVIEGEPLPFSKKLPVAFWRGATTDNGWDPQSPSSNQRRNLVEHWALNDSNYIDVGLTALIQDAEGLDETYGKYVKPSKPVDEQVKYRYLISCEGNDVATGLKWMLATGSVVIKPPARRESWALESHLIPWQHYVPVRPDFSDLLERIAGCEADLPRCAEIGRRGRERVRWYANSTRTFEVASLAIRSFLDRVNVSLVEGASSSSLDSGMGYIKGRIRGWDVFDPNPLGEMREDYRK